MTSEKNDEREYGSIDIVCPEEDGEMGVDVEKLIQPEKEQKSLRKLLKREFRKQ